MIQYNQKETKEDKKMKTRGWYEFEDGYTCWVNGLSAREKKNLIARHGKIVRFQHTN